MELVLSLQGNFKASVWNKIFMDALRYSGTFLVFRFLFLEIDVCAIFDLTNKTWCVRTRVCVNRAESQSAFVSDCSTVRDNIGNFETGNQLFKFQYNATLPLYFRS